MKIEMKFEKEVHQECENFITYNVYKIIDEKENKRKFLYRTSINKIQDMYSKPGKELYKMDAVARGEV